MSAAENRHVPDKIKFSIGAKLRLLVFFILILSLGSITALVSLLVYRDTRASVEENNLEVNRRLAMETEALLVNVRSNSFLMMNSASSAELNDMFFYMNPRIAALYYVTEDRREYILVNNLFFSFRGIDQSRVQTFFQSYRSTMGSAANGNSFLINAAVQFGHPVLALFFPWNDGGAGGVLFSSDSLVNSYNIGKSRSLMINSYGEVLIFPDFFYVRAGRSFVNEDFIRLVMNSTERNGQILTDSNSDFLLELTNPDEDDFFLFVWKSIKLMFTDAKLTVLSLYNKAAEFISQLEGNSHWRPVDINQDKKTRQFIAYTKINTAGVTVISVIDYDNVTGRVAAVTMINICLTIIALCFSLLFVWLLSRSVSIPVKRLVYAVRQIENGNFDQELPFKRKDEVTLLTSAFNRMCLSLQIFGKFTNNDIVLKTMRGEVKIGGFSKHATILFSEIYDFKDKTEYFSRAFGYGAPEKIVNWLNDYFTRMIECIEKTDGVTDKIISDSLMAHWGTASTAGSPRKDAFNCIKAALMMRKAIYKLNRERKTEDPNAAIIRVGCGINSDNVIAGQLGTDNRMEYTVVGEPVNYTFKIKSLAKSFDVDILISENTWRLIGDKFITEEMPPTKIKGKEKPVRLFAVINFKGDVKGPKTADELHGYLSLR